MCGRTDQINNEIILIARYLTEARKNKTNSFSTFVIPKIHTDTCKVVWLHKKQRELDILAYDVDEFVTAVSVKNRIGELLNG